MLTQSVCQWWSRMTEVAIKNSESHLGRDQESRTGVASVVVNVSREWESRTRVTNGSLEWESRMGVADVRLESESRNEVANGSREMGRQKIKNRGHM